MSYKIIFSRSVACLAALLASSLLFAGTVQAGTCAVFCKALIGNTVTRTAGGACSDGAACSNARCPGTSLTASEDDIRRYCALTTPEGGNDQASAWCGDYLGESSPASRRESFAGRCASPYSARDRDSLPEGSAVGGGTAPPPARPGDQFRCQFMCSGDTASRNGSTCTAATDQATCARECLNVCGQDSCAGVRAGGLMDNSASAVNQQPRCVATQTNQNNAPNFAGITDTLQFETINESFRNISLPLFLGNVIRVMIGFAGALFLLMLMWAGLRWATAGENKTIVEAAQKTLRNAVIGIIVVAASYILVTAVIELFGTVTSGIASTP